MLEHLDLIWKQTDNYEFQFTLNFATPDGWRGPGLVAIASCLGKLFTILIFIHKLRFIILPTLPYLIHGYIWGQTGGKKCVTRIKTGLHVQNLNLYKKQS